MSIQASVAVPSCPDLFAAWDRQITVVNLRFHEMTRADTAYLESVRELNRLSDELRAVGEQRRAEACRTLSKPPLQHAPINDTCD